MKANIRLTLAAFALSLTTAATAQHSNSAYFLEGNTMRHNLNPALEVEHNYVSMPVLGNINVGLRGNLGLQDLFFNKNGKTTTFLSPDVTWSEVQSGLKDKNKLQSDINIQFLGAGFRAFGGFNTIGLGVRVTEGFQAPLGLFDLVKNLQNQNYNVGKTDVHIQSWAELALGHSHAIGENLRVGGKLKFLFGIARLDAKLDELNLNLANANQWTATANAEVNAYMKGFTWKHKKEDYKQEARGSYDAIEKPDVDGAGLGGFGLGVDLGAEYDFKDLVPGLKASIAMLDLGFISWSNHVQAVNHGKPFAFNGFQNTRIKDGEGVKLSDQTDKLVDDLTDLYYLEDKGDQGSAIKGIGATLNAGVEYALPMYSQVKFGLLSSTRFQGDYTWNEERISANYSPLSWLEGNINFGIGTYGADFGWQLNIHPKGFNFFIGMDHLLGKVSKQFIPLNSRAQFSMGMNVTF